MCAVRPSVCAALGLERMGLSERNSDMRDEGVHIIRRRSQTTSGFWEGIRYETDLEIDHVLLSAWRLSEAAPPPQWFPRVWYCFRSQQVSV